MNSSVAASVSVEDMVQTSVFVSSDVGIQLPVLAQLDFNESEAQDSESLTDLFFDVECISRKTQ